jgi:hypothetical protein
MDHAFQQLDDLVLHLKGLVLVRKYRERHGADPSELAMFSEEIERVRDRLATVVRYGNIPQAAAQR